MATKSKKIDLNSQDVEQYLRRKAKTGSIYALFQLFNRYFLKSAFGPIFVFLFPLILYGILGAAMGYRVLFGGMLSQISMSVGVLNIPGAILELKNSVLLRRIGASPIPAWKFTIVIIFYFLLVTIIAQIWICLIALIFFQDPSIFSELGSGIRLVSFLFGLFSNWLMATCLGFSIAAIAKTDVQANLIAFLFFYPSVFLSGQNISIELIVQNDTLNWISRFVPFRYTTMFITSAVNSTSGNPLLLQDVYISSQISFDASGVANEVLAYSAYESIIAYCLIPAFTAATLSIAIWKFSWGGARR